MAELYCSYLICYYIVHLIIWLAYDYLGKILVEFLRSSVLWLHALIFCIFIEVKKYI